MDELLELLKKRRSIRRFKPDPVPEEYIGKILEAGRWAMSGANGQPWEFIVVKERENIRRIADAWLEVRKEQYAIEQTRVEEYRQPQLSRPPTSPPGFREAPLLIVVLGDRRTLQATVLSTNFIPGEGGPGALYFKNMANATQNLHLACAALGLGSQWLSCNHMWEQAIKSILDIPPALDVHTLVAVGEPAYTPEPTYRRELKEIVHWEKYDRSKYRSGEDVIRFLAELRKRTKPAYRQEDGR
ncbi:MAG: nitroreductase family protein [Chloroflexota bacterium]